jgi:hypothetical protein
MDAPIPDPYRHCEVACNHDLSRGVTISELLGDDGPHPAGTLLVNLPTQRPALLNEEHQELAGQMALPTREAV